MARGAAAVAVLACGLFCLALPVRPALAQGTVISVQEARVLAANAVGTGRAAEARAIALTLLQRDAGDVQALVVLSRAERLLQNYPAAARAGRRAWKAAETPQARYTSAVLTAQALAADNKRLRAQLWLRRALQVAPTPELRNKAIRDFQLVRSATPLSVALRFSIAPSDNINNGSQHNTSLLENNPSGLDLSSDAQALSGIEYSFGTTLRYRLPATKRRQSAVWAAFDARAFTLSSEAEAQIAADPSSTSTASDFAFESLRFGYDLTTVSEDRRSATSFGAAFGRNWFGGSGLSHFAQISLGRGWQVNPRNALNLSLALERQNRLDFSDRSADIFTLSGAWTHRFSNANTLRLGAYLRDNHTENSTFSYDALGVNVSFAPARPILGQTALTLGLTFETREYDAGFFRPSIPREEERISASAVFQFRDLDYFGFSPTATIVADQTNSTEQRFETERLSLRLGLQSSF